MELTVIDRVPRKVQITLPCYRKNSAHHYKVIAEDKTLTVFSGYELKSCGIETSSHMDSALDERNEPSTEQEFNEAFNKVINKLKDEKGN